MKAERLDGSAGSKEEARLGFKYVDLAAPHKAAVLAANAQRLAVLNLHRDTIRKAAACFDVGAVSLGRAYERNARSQIGRLHTLPDVVSVAYPFTAAELLPRERAPLAFDAADSSIRMESRRAAALCSDILQDSDDPMDAYARCRNVCHARAVEPPPIQGDGPLASVPALARMADPVWWRRELRKLVKRRVEALRVASGKVQRHADPYCSDDGVERWRQAVRRNRDLLAALVAVNEAGDEFTLADLADKSISNPELKRAELMVRVKGIEQHADQQGHVADFLTITLESLYHATIAETGKPNPAYRGANPREGQAELCRQWRLIRARLAKRGIKLYGLRVAEPHHDACPHWHLLVFGTVADLNTARRVIRDVVLAHNGDETGAARHRFKAERVDKSKGSAVAYVAKYLAKNVDGKALEMAIDRDPVTGREFYTGAAISAAERISAWASTWGLRQFQFFGTVAVGPYRELRRLDGPVESISIEAARLPADAGDFGAYIAASAGIEPYKQGPIDADGVIALNRYGEECKPRVFGVQWLGGLMHVITRLHRWIIKQGSKLDPWTRVNNCNRPAALAGISDSIPPEYPPPPIAPAPDEVVGPVPAGPETRLYG